MIFIKARFFLVTVALSFFFNYAQGCVGLSGTYTIGGSSPNYATFTAAVNALVLKGVCGPVVFNVRDGNYNEQIKIPAITGASATNSITFQSQNGDSSKVKLFFSTTTTAANNYTIKLTGACYVNIKRISISRPPISGNYYSLVIDMDSGSSYDTIQGNMIIGSKITPVYMDRFGALVGDPTLSEIDSFDVITGNNMEYGVMGVYFWGPSFQRLNDGIVITNNIIDSTAAYGAYLIFQDNPVINNNKFYNNGYLSNSGNGGAIYILDDDDAPQVRNNYIHTVNTSYSIYMNNSNYYYGTNLNKAIVSNNMIVISPQITGSTTEGIYAASNYYTDFEFNSVLNLGVGSDNDGVVLANYYSNIRNNIFSANGGPAVDYSWGYNEASDYNDYYTTGPLLTGKANVYYSTLAKWQAASAQDAHTLNVKPYFNSNTDLHTSDIDLYQKGVPVSGITTDIDGRTRNASTPDIGADEFNVYSLDAQLISVDSPATGNCSGSHSIYATLRNNGTSTLTSANISYSINGGSSTTTSWTGSLASSATSSVLLGSFSFASGTTYSIVAHSSSPNGGTDLNPYNDTARLTFESGLSGTYTIGGASANYPSFSAAANDLSLRGICGPVTFNVASGTYTDRIFLNQIAGSSASNTITFQGTTADSSKVVLRELSSDASTNYIISLNGTSYITFRKMTISHLGNGYYANDITVIGGAHNVTITNCQIERAGAYSGNSADALVYCGGSADSNNVFNENFMYGGTYAFYYLGTSYNYIASGTVISNNIIDSADYYAIYSEWQTKLTVTGNIIEGLAYTSNYNLGGSIYCYGVVSPVISNNKIMLNVGQAGIGTGGTINGLIYNNFISIYGPSNSNTAYGISCTNDQNLGVYFNNISITGLNSGLGDISIVDAYPNGVSEKNNIFANTGGGLGLYVPSSGYLKASDYNDYYITGADVVSYLSVKYPTLASFSSSIGFDTHSITVNPNFKAFYNLHSTDTALAGKGNSIAVITTDIDGKLRYSPPTIGANELYVLADAGISSIDTPSSSFCAAKKDISVTIKSYGYITLRTATIDWTIDGVAQTAYNWTGSLTKGNTQSGILLGSYSFAAGNHTIKAWVASPDGRPDSSQVGDTSTITVGVGTMPVAYAGANQEICAAGNSTIIGPSTLYANNSYSWTSTPYGFTSTLSNPIVSPTATTTYSLVITNTVGGCASSPSAVQVTLGTPSSIPYGTYFGSTGADFACGTAVDKYGNTYYYGTTSSSSGIATAGAYQTLFGGGSFDEFLAKFNCSGALVWSTYYGGTGFDAGGYGVVVDDSGYIYFSGSTTSPNNIASAGAYQTNYGGNGANDAFIAKFSPSGSRVWGTYFGGPGDDQGPELKIDGNGNIVLTGRTNSTSGIASSGAFQTNNAGGYDAFIAKFSSTGSILWSTYLGGSSDDYGYSTAIDSSNNIYITGQTYSSSGIATSGAYQTSLAGTTNAFVTKLSASGTKLWSTYFGGSGTDLGRSIAVDPSQNIVILGQTSSSSGIATAGAYQTSYGGSNDAFIAKLNPSGARQWATYYGGSGTEFGYAIVTDALSNIYISGYTSGSPGLSTVGSYQAGFGGGNDDGIVAKFSNTGYRLWASYFGGNGTDYCQGSLTVDNNSDLYFSGYTGSGYGIATSGAFQTAFSGGTWDAFYAKLSTTFYNDAGVSSIISPSSSFCAGSQAVKVQIENYGKGKLTSAKINWEINGIVQTPYSWTGSLNTNSTSNVTIGNYNFSTSGAITIKAWTSKPNGVTDSVPANDSASSLVTVISGPIANAGADQEICAAGNATIIGPSSLSANNTYGWASSPTGFTSTLSNPIVSPASTTDYILTIKNTITGCSSSPDTVQVTVGTGMPADYGTYFGGNGTDLGGQIARDLFGNVYIIGNTSSTTGIATKGAYQTAYGGGPLNAFLAKYDCGGQLQWATYFGGGSLDQGFGVTTDDTGNVYITGPATSSGLATAGTYQTANAGAQDVYIAKFNTSGALKWATYYGGPDYEYGFSIRLDTAGNIYVSGATNSGSGIATNGTYQTTYGGGTDDAFIAKFNNSGTKLLWGSYFGGGAYEHAGAMVLDKSTNIFISGYTTSGTGISTAGAYQSKLAGATNAFIAKFNNNGSLAWGTYYGGANNDYSYQMAIDTSGSIFITGGATSSSGIASAGAYQTALTGSEDAFVAKFSNSGSRLWATYYGGPNSSYGQGVATDVFGDLYLSGYTSSSSGIATTGAYQTALGGGTDAFYAKFSGAGTRLWASYYGGANADEAYGITTDNAGNIYSSGYTSSSSGIATSGAFQSSLKGMQNAYFVKLNTSFYNDAGINSIVSPSSAFCPGIQTVKVKLEDYGKNKLTSDSIHWAVNGVSQTAIKWVGSLNTDSTATVTLGNYNFSTSGAIAIKAWSTKPNGVKDSITGNDTASAIITVNPLPASKTGGPKAICLGSSTSIGAAPVSGDSYAWTSTPNGYSSTSSQPTISPTTTTTYYLRETINATGCFLMNNVVITVNPLPAAANGGNKAICDNSSTTIGAASVTGDTYAWTSSPSGFTSTSSKPTVSPTTTTIYYLTETITATNCSKSDSVIITVNPLPAANAGSAQAICFGGSAGIGAKAVVGDTYIWSSNPSGYSSTLSNPTVSPTATTTYTVTETVTATNCSNSNTVIITVNSLPAANTGSSKAICSGSSTTVGAAAVGGDTYVWASNPSGFTSTQSKPTISPTVTTTYYLTETVTATNCSKSDSLVITVNTLPAAATGSNKAICNGSSTTIGAASVSGDTYAWTSKPSGFTSTLAKPTISPTATTTYYLTETVTATTCGKADSVVIIVNPLPSANAGSAKAICNGGSASIGSASVAGHTYVWVSNPLGYNNTNANPTVNPTTTTTYTLTETITATNCSKSNSVIITVNPLPAASTGSNQAICLGASTTVGAGAVSGDTYAWTSNPSGFTSTASKPSVSPTATTTYYLTETVTATACSKSDSVIVTVNPLPAAKTVANQAICLNASLNIGASAVIGSTYSWSSVPSGYNSTASNPSASPTVTTTYYLTEKITATGCTKTDSVVITVNALPAANNGGNKAICFGSSTSIGAAAVGGDTYSWTSNPSGFTSTSSKPTINPTITTTYYLTEKITATGCSKSDTVVITVNPLPAANNGGNKAICYGGSTTIGAVAVGGDTYVWTSNPSGFTSTSSKPTVNPTATTTYYLTEKITATGCSKSDSAVLTVNPLPAANNGGNKSICLNASTTVGVTAVAGDTYAWTSHPSGFSSTLSQPTVNPTATTTYYLTEKITATGCSNSDSMILTVNPLPLANTGSNRIICSGNSISIGSASVIGNTYLWASKPSGYSSTLSNPSVSPSTTTTYYLTETITATNCNKTDSMIVTVNPLPNAKTGANQAICIGGNTSIGAAAVGGNTYSWTSNPIGFTSTQSKPSVSPTITTTYYLTEKITATTCSKTDSVIVTVNPLPAANTGSAQAICKGGNTSIGMAGVIGNTYSWTSNPSGFNSTQAQTIVSPTLATTYTLTEKVTATGCSNSNSVVISVNPLPVANAGSTQTVCAGSPASIGASGINGHTYSWTSNPVGFTSTLSNPTVNPTITTVYTLVETITATGCSNANAVTINTNPLPAANTGGAKAVCVGHSAKIGAAPVGGDTYSWISSPAGYTSTVSNPTITPTVTGTYYLTETITATGCRNTDSVLIYLTPPALTGGNQPLCTGHGIQLGSTPLGDDQYLWKSVPAGFNDTLSNPIVNPTITTTYILTETVRNGGCFKTDTAVITVYPVPTPHAGSAQTSCAGSSVTIGGSSTLGHTYAWVSNPASVIDSVSNPTVNPTVTTTYYVTEIINATGCNKSDSVVITVNPLPAANAGSNTSVCFGGNTFIGAAGVTGNTYLWTSKPSGYSSTLANPVVSPTLTTTYYLTEKITATGCKNSDSIIVIVNPLPAANAGANSSICLNSSTTIGAAALSGNTYSWVSSPIGFSDTTSNPMVNPTANTTYTLTETITATGCNKAHSVVVKINPLPAANAGSPQVICLNGSATIGAAALGGDTYSWSSNPSGFASVSSKPSVSPTTTATYYLTEKITLTGCTKSDSVTVTVNPLPSANAGTNSAICLGGNAPIGATAVGGDTYAWSSKPNGYSSTVSSAMVSPTTTTTYYLTETITATNCNKSDSVIITVNPLPFASTIANQAICLNSSVSIGAATVIGDSYSWASNPSGFTDTTSNPSVSPTVATTYYLTEKVTSTGCSNSDSVLININPLPLANAGTNSAVCIGNNAPIGATAVAGDSYAWTSNPSGYISTTSKANVSPTVTTTYYLTEKINATGCNKTDSLIITVNQLPNAKTGSNTSICTGNSTIIGDTAVIGNTYVWTSKPVGFNSTASNPSVSPTVTTTYTLNETDTTTMCGKSNTVVITVNPLPKAKTGSGQTICSGSSASIGAVAVVGDSYTWTSNPPGFADTTSKPTVSPTTTTTYYLTESITATGCNYSDSVIITVNPLPAANTGGNQTICKGTSISIGDTAISGNTYVWKSNPSGYNSTNANPSVSPAVTTTYYLTEKITATNCGKSDSAVITVNPLPAANAGSGSTICSGGSASIGSTAISGNTYSWTSYPTGFADTSANPNVSPTITTTYYLTETITASNCNKSDSVVIKVNPLPAANAGSSSTICSGSSASVGAIAVGGDTYDWTSNPSGYSSTVSNPSVSPTVTTTYYLTEKIKLTGCSNSDSVVITVNPIPAANAGSSTAICFGGNDSIGAASVSGDSYSWTSKPAGYSDTTSNPVVSPTITTTYYLTEMIVATGCSKSDSVIIKVNPLPNATTGSNAAICFGGNTAIGGTAVIGDTYAWTSNPSGFASTSSNPSVGPTLTTTYYLTEKVTVTGCGKSDSVVITVNPLPAANAGSNAVICSGGTSLIGASSVIGNTYSWVSKPVGYSDTASNPTIGPTTTTTYYLTEKVTATGCNKSDSVVITVNPLPAAITGVNTTICFGGSTAIGGASVIGNTYSWTSKPSGYTDSVSNPTVNPPLTTTYYLTEKVTTTGCNKSDSVVVTVNPLPNANAGSNNAICIGGNAQLGAINVNGNTYSWVSKPAGFTDSVSSPIVSPVAVTTYYLTEKVTATGCSKTDSVIIMVNPVPLANAGRDTAICAGSSIPVGGASVAGNTYSWVSKPTGFTDTVSNPMISPIVTTTYYLTEKIGISGCSKSDSVVITVNSLPVAKWTSVDSNGRVTFTPDNQGYASYLWVFGDGDSSILTSPEHTYKTDSTYLVKLLVSNASGCNSEYDSSITVSITGIYIPQIPVFSLNIYPNPFKTETNISYQIGKTVHIRIEVTDLQMKSVAVLTDEIQPAGSYTSTLNSAKYDLATGTYLVKIYADGQQVTKQVIKLR